MENKTEISETESLAIIQSMINRAKDKFSENGHLYLVWGWTVLVCSLAQYILVKYVHYEKHYLVWLLIIVVIIYQAIYLARKKRTEVVRTYTGNIIGYVWISFAIVMTVMSYLFRNMPEDMYHKVFNPGILALYGIPTFLSGVILRFRALIVGGIGCWLLSMAATWVNPVEQLLFLTAAMIVAWIVPGYLLRAKYKKQNG